VPLHRAPGDASPRAVERPGCPLRGGRGGRGAWRPDGERAAHRRATGPRALLRSRAPRGACSGRARVARSAGR